MMVGLYWGINFLRGRDIFSRSNAYYAEYEQVNGLVKSSKITSKGVKIGVVDGIIYDPTRSGKVVLELSIDSKYQIPDNSQARIYSSGLMEGKAIEIVMGNSPKPLKDGATIHSFSDPGLLEMAGTEFSGLAEKVSRLADNAAKLLGTANELLEANRGNVDAMVGNVATLTGALAAERASLHNIVQNINVLTASLAQTAPLIDTTMRNVSAFSGQLSAVDLKRLDNSLQELERLLTGINDGRGTIGRLAADDSLYNAMNHAVGDLSLLLEDVKANPDRYVTISVFGNKEKADDKAARKAARRAKRTSK